jgi:hypothetical protein
MRLLPILVLAGGCVSATFHSQTGATPPAVTGRAIVAPDPDALGGQAQHLGTVDLSAPAAAGDGQDDLLDKASHVAADHGGTHLVVRAAGSTPVTVTTPASSSESCTQDADGNGSCTTTYTPESTNAYDVPYATYDVYRVEPVAWPSLPADERPAAVDPARLTPSGADGPGVAIGWFSIAHPLAATGTSGMVFPTAYTAGPSQANGLWLSGSRTRGSAVIAADLGVGGGSFTGIAQSLRDGGQVPYTTTYGGLSFAVRAGAQAALGDAAFAAGVGVGGAVWMGMPSYDASTFVFVEPPDGNLADLYLPLWASLTIKPSCDWGVQAMASYDVRPLDTQASAPSLALGLLWQPASACR